MRLSNTDLETLRQRPHQTRLDLFIFQPRTIFQARVNDVSITKGARSITFDSVSLGSYLDIEADMTCLVGSSLGASDLGRIRVKSATSSVITVSENSNIPWADNLFLTVLRYWEVWPIFPRIIPNPSVVDDVIFYKDYDIAYTNQNSILGTFVNAGPHRPVLIESSTGTAYYSSTGTYNVLGDSLTYDWAFEGGTPTGSTSANPGNVYYSTPGNYVTRLIVTSSSGAVDTTYRYVSVKNKIGEGSTTPIVRWGMNPLSGSRSEGGYSTEFTVYDNITLDDNAVVMLRSDDWYGNSHTSLGGNYPNSSQIFYVGYIESGSIKYDYQKSLYTFRASSVTQMMKSTTGFSVSVESMAVPTKWYELLDLDCRRAMYHYLRWHSTVLKTTDFNFTGTDYKIQFFDADRVSLYDAVNSLMQGTLVGDVSADRQGRLWAEVKPKSYPNPTGTFTPVMDITNRDWMGQPSIEESYGGQVSYIEYGGVAFSGVFTGTYSPLLADAPGGVPAFRGTTEKVSGLALYDQAQLNQMVGNAYANANSRYPTVAMDMAIPVRNLDIAPYEVIRVQVNPTDTVRGIALDKLYIPDSLSWNYDPENQILTSSLSGINVVSGAVGETIVIPELPEEAGFTNPPATVPSVPSLSFPSIFSAGITNIIGSIIMTAKFNITGTMTGSESRQTFLNTIISSTMVSRFSDYLIVHQPGIYLVSAYVTSQRPVSTAETSVVCRIGTADVGDLGDSDTQFQLRTQHPNLAPTSITLISSNSQAMRLQAGQALYYLGTCTAGISVNTSGQLTLIRLGS